MPINPRTLRRRGLGVLFLAVVVGLLYLSILFYDHAFTTTMNVTLRAGCLADSSSGSGAPPAPSTQSTQPADTAADGNRARGISGTDTRRSQTTTAIINTTAPARKPSV